MFNTFKANDKYILKQVNKKIVIYSHKNALYAIKPVLINIIIGFKGNQNSLQYILGLVLKARDAINIIVFLIHNKIKKAFLGFKKIYTYL